MKRLSLIALLVSTGVAMAAAPEKKGPPDLALAKTWAAHANVLVGKEVETCVQEIGEIGSANSNSPCVVIPVVTGNARGESGGEILALVPLTSAQSFVENAVAAGSGKSTNFGTKVVPKVTRGTLAAVEGELVLVIGTTMPSLGGKKPSALLAEQRGGK